MCNATHEQSCCVQCKQLIRQPFRLHIKEKVQFVELQPSSPQMTSMHDNWRTCRRVHGHRRMTNCLLGKRYWVKQKYLCRAWHTRFSCLPAVRNVPVSLQASQLDQDSNRQASLCQAVASGVSLDHTPEPSSCTSTSTGSMQRSSWEAELAFALPPPAKGCG